MTKTKDKQDEPLIPSGDEPAPAPGEAADEPDYYLNAAGFVVFTRSYHLRRGYCCKSGCLHCPYGYPRRPS